MKLTTLLLFISAAAALKSTYDVPLDGQEITIVRLPTYSNPDAMTDLQVTDHVLELKRATSTSIGSRYVQAMRQAGASFDGGVVRLSNGSTQLIPAEAGQVFLAPVTVGGQQFEVIIDTGSSDPWLVTSNFTCVNPYTGAVQDEQDCYFGTPYNASNSSTYSLIANQNFNITYSDQEILNGLMALESFTMAGIRVPQQKFAVVNYAAWTGDGYSSGLVGFAYSTLTSAYRGTNPSADQRGAQLLYNPLFTNMYNLSLVPPVFSMAINRDPNNGGVMALGGIPNIPHSPYWVSTPIQSVGVFIGTTTPAYEFYSVQSDGFAYSASPNTQFNPYSTTNSRKTHLSPNGTVIVDSGTSLVYAPNSVADGVAAAFSPPAAFDDDIGAYVVDCAAKPPVFGVSINKKIFYVNPADLIVPNAVDRCISGVQPNYGGLTIVGDVWMKNVICVFDIGAEMMRFAAREFYGLTSTSKRADT